MKKSTKVWAVVILLIIIGAGGWYWWMMMSKQGAYQAKPTQNLGINGSPNQTNNGQPATAVLTVAHDTTMGDYLVAANGMTLYSFTKDTTNTSNCSGQCAVLWPPYAPNNNPLMAGAGVSGTISTITRADGTSQITYNGVPLYFWQGDSKVGDTTGNNYNGVWFVVKP
jgi:predicted lipoprotein with Yx(FWY)xxD motif